MFEKLTSAFNTLSSDENPSQEEKNALSAFADKFITVTLKDPRTRGIASKVQRHRHTKTCERQGVICRFDFPKLPSMYTMLTVPSRVTLLEDEDRKELHRKIKVVTSKIRSVIECEEVMEEIISIHQDDFEEIYEYRDIAIRSTRILEDPHFRNQILNKEFSGDSGDNICEDLLDNLMELKSIYEIKVDQVSAGEIDWRRERLLAVLSKADIADLLEVDEESEEQWNAVILEKYHELLTHSTKGYGVVLTRDVDECWINKYNPEFLEVWDGNIDVALVFDMYAVVTYIADYYMKVRMNTNLLIIISSDIHSIHFRTTRERWRC